MTTKEEWISIIDQEEGQKLALNIVEEVLSKTQSVIFQRKIEQQLVPYTLNYVKNTVLGVIQAFI
jgi:hypothetical protein